MSAPRVAVIGAGLAGLAAAVRLRQLGASVVVFERDADVGGVVQTLQRDGWTIDTGPAMAAEPPPRVRDLLDAIGMQQCTVRAGASGGTRYVVLQGRPVVVPRTTSEFSSSSVLSLAGRLRLLKERFIPSRADAADESVASFARRRFGDEMAERMFDPLLASTCAGDASEILARYAFPALVGHERGTGSALQGGARARLQARRRAKGRPTGSWSCGDGMHQLAQHLARSAGEVRLDSPVTGLATHRRGAQVTAAGRTEEFAAALVALPAPALAKVELDPALRVALQPVTTMPHASIAVVALGFRREDVGHPLDGSRLLVPSCEGRAILSAVFPSSVFPERAPPGHVLITVFVGGARQPELVDRPDDELVSLVCGELGLLLDVSGAPVMARVTRRHDALPQAVAGHGARLAAADAIEATSPSLAFAGSWRDGLSVGDVLLGGIDAAERLGERGGLQRA